MQGEHITIQLLWATARQLVTRVNLIYLVDKFFIFSLLVLLKETRTQGETKISSCYFVRELGGRGEGVPRLPCVTQVVESFSSDLFRAIISYLAESYLESCQPSTMELSLENNQWL